MIVKSIFLQEKRCGKLNRTVSFFLFILMTALPHLPRISTPKTRRLIATDTKCRKSECSLCRRRRNKFQRLQTRAKTASADFAKAAVLRP
jgi:hypothetical protein